MFWHDLGRLALEVGTPLAAIRVLTWLVALFGSERLSRRAMSLLRRIPKNRARPFGDEELARLQADIADWPAR